MKRGFTLIEIMVAMSIFIVVMTISLGAILGIFTENTNAQQIKAAFDNLNSGVETMTRELRFGTQWHCGAIGGDITSPQECQGNTPGSQIAFLASDGTTRTIYRLNGTAIEKSIDGGATFIPVTSNEVTINQFIVIAVGLGTGVQPKAYIFIKGTAGTKNPTPFTLQSLVSQRVLNTGIFTVTQGGSAPSCTDTGLLGCWLFDEGLGLSSTDSTGNGHTAAFKNSASWVSGQTGTAVSLPGNGSGDEVDISGASLGSTSVTVSAWFKLPNSPTEATFSASLNQLGAVIFTTRTNDSDVSPTLVVTPVDGGSGNGSLGVAFTCDSGALAVGAKSITTPANGSWQHAVGVYQAGGGHFAGTWTIYLNGSPVSNNFDLTPGTDCPGNFTGSTWYLGQAPTWPGESSVAIDNVRVYNRALSPSEVAALP